MPEELYPVLKTCRTCRAEKPLDEFHRKSRSKDGHSGQCKSCQREYAAKKYAEDPGYFSRYYAANRERIVAQRKDYRQQNPSVIAAQGKRYRLENPEKVREQGRRRREKNHEQILERERQYRQRPEIKIRGLKVMQEWRAKNKERWLATKKAWEQRNPDKVRAIRLIHNHKQRGAAGSFTIEEWDALCAKYGNRCLCCNRDDLPMTVDHIVPICKGGTNYIDNLQPLCSPCNIRKRCKIIDYRPEHQAVVQAALF